MTAGIQLVERVDPVVVAARRHRARRSRPTRASLALAALLGLIGAGAYLAYFTGLRIGPIAVVSGMVAAYGGLTVVLSVVLRGESLTPLQAARRGDRDGRRHPDRRRLRWRPARAPGSPARASSSRSSRSSCSR